MFEGIISQYGFYYQRLVFICLIINSASINRYFVYEGVDDIDISSNKSEEISMTTISDNKYIQVKSGQVSEAIWSKIIGNWILTNDYFNGNFELICENDLPFNRFDTATIDKVYKYFNDGSGKRINSIARKVHDLLFPKMNAQEIKDLILELSKRCVISVVKLDEVKTRIRDGYIHTYCSDIKIYNRAKEFRVERLVERVMSKIDSSIAGKSKCVIDYKSFMDIVLEVSHDINDKRYNVNVSELSKSKRLEAEKLVNDSQIREIRQLKLVNNNPEFVCREIVKELLYKDFRSVFTEGSEVSTDVRNMEYYAHSNYQDVIFSLTGEVTPYKVFFETIGKDIPSTIVEQSPIYKNGCYIFMTGDDIDSEQQISWGDENE